MSNTVPHLSKNGIMPDEATHTLRVLDLTNLSVEFNDTTHKYRGTCVNSLGLPIKPNRPDHRD